MEINEARLKALIGDHSATILGLAKQGDVKVSEWEIEEIEDAFETGYRAGHRDGAVDVSRKESPNILAFKASN